MPTFIAIQFMPGCRGLVDKECLSNIWRCNAAMRKGA